MRDSESSNDGDPSGRPSQSLDLPFCQLEGSINPLALMPGLSCQSYDQLDLTSASGREGVLDEMVLGTILYGSGVGDGGPFASTSWSAGVGVGDGAPQVCAQNNWLGSTGVGEGVSFSPTLQVGLGDGGSQNNWMGVSGIGEGVLFGCTLQAGTGDVGSQNNWVGGSGVAEGASFGSRLQVGSGKGGSQNNWLPSKAVLTWNSNGTLNVPTDLTANVNSHIAMPTLSWDDFQHMDPLIFNYNSAEYL